MFMHNQELVFQCLRILCLMQLFWIRVTNVLFTMINYGLVQCLKIIKKCEAYFDIEVIF